MSTQYSPGPWSYKEYGSQILDRREGSKQTLVATVSINTYRDEGRYNARLIAAAPELLEALQSMLAIVDDSQGVAGYHLNGEIASWGEFDEINAACAAITKATGT